MKLFHEKTPRERLIDFAAESGPDLAPYQDHRGFDHHDRLREDVRDLLRERPSERTKLFQHADGGFYVRVEAELETEMKMDDGSWQLAVHYRSVMRHGHQLTFANRKQYTTTAARWAERFTEIDRNAR
jgi:hypothetical protein